MVSHPENPGPERTESGVAQLAEIRRHCVQLNTCGGRNGMVGMAMARLAALVDPDAETSVGRGAAMLPACRASDKPRRSASSTRLTDAAWKTLTIEADLLPAAVLVRGAAACKGGHILNVRCDS